eukprot:jgi/Orpsp1_1/1191629/evm.model.d7180000087446.1
MICTGDDIGILTGRDIRKSFIRYPEGGGTAIGFGTDDDVVRVEGTDVGIAIGGVPQGRRTEVVVAGNHILMIFGIDICLANGGTPWPGETLISIHGVYVHILISIGVGVGSGVVLVILILIHILVRIRVRIRIGIGIRVGL